MKLSSFETATVVSGALFDAGGWVAPGWQTAGRLAFTGMIVIIVAVFIALGR